jgi:hypothetical protein
MSSVVTSPRAGYVTFRVSGKLRAAHLREAQKAAAEVIEKQGPVRVLLLLENYEGAASGDDWSDMSFQAKYDRDIVRMAVVGEKQWHASASMFIGKGLRHFPIEFFTPSEMEKADRWLAE